MKTPIAVDVQRLPPRTGRRVLAVTCRVAEAPARMTDARELSVTDFRRLVEKARAGDVEALDELLGAMKTELRRTVQRVRRRRADVSMRTTEIFNEAFLKVFRKDVPDFADPEHLLATWTNATSWVVIEAWRKRGRRPTLDSTLDAMVAPEIARAFDDPLAVQRAFEALKESLPREGLAAELKLLGGQSAAEIADALDVSEPTVRRWVRAASSWLRVHAESETPAAE